MTRGITKKTATLVFRICFETGEMPAAIVERNNWWINRDFDTIATLVKSVIEGNQNLLTVYRSGQTKVYGAFLGAFYKLQDSHIYDIDIVENILKWMLDYDGLEYYGLHKNAKVEVVK